MRRLPAVVVLAGALLAGACRPDTVRLAFRAVPGATAAYHVDVHVTTVSSLGDGAPRRTDDHVRVRVDQTVLDAVEGGSRVKVRLTSGAEHATFIVTVGPALAVVGVDRIEGLAPQTLGDLGLAELLPAATTRPPLRPVRIGSSWAVRSRANAPGAPAADLVGRARLVALGVVGGVVTATTESTVQLPVRRAFDRAEGRLALDGTQTTTSRTTADVDTGRVESARSTTAGRYRVSLTSTDVVGAPPVGGTVAIDVRSTTQRIR